MLATSNNGRLLTRRQAGAIAALLQIIYNSLIQFCMNVAPTSTGGCIQVLVAIAEVELDTYR